MSEILFQCTIPGRTRILKNSKKLIRNKTTGRMFPVSSDRYKKWEFYATIYVLRAKSQKTIDYPVAIEVRLYFKDHQHEPDATNASEGIFDLLEKCQVLKNDKLIYLVTVEKIFSEPNERAEVILKKYVEKT